MSLRLFEQTTGTWRIWWASTVGNGALDPPVEGRFQDGVGTFETDDDIDGVPIRVQFTWKDITPDSAHWEQRFSFDGGRSWDLNWTTPHTALPPGRARWSHAVVEREPTDLVADTLIVDYEIADFWW